jgi:hypothetical protein
VARGAKVASGGKGGFSLDVFVNAPSTIWEYILK